MSQTRHAELRHAPGRAAGAQSSPCSRRSSLVGVAILRADPTAGAAADAVGAVGNGHHHHLVVIIGIVYIGWTAWQSGLSVDQLVALVLSLVGALANSNRPAVQARTRARRWPSLED